MMSIQTNKLPDNPQIEVIKSGKTGLFTNYIYKAIPLAFDESMSYYETLCGLLHYLKNVIIPTVNNNADAVAELQTLYEELRIYVDNYFTNLDVQEEINNKLDEMAANGYFNNLLMNYTSIVKYFDTTVEILADSNLIKGQKVKSLGYYEKFDEGSALFEVDDTENNNILQLKTNNGMYLNLVLSDSINPKYLGCKDDGVFDNTELFKKIITYASNNNIKIEFTGNTYLSNKLIFKTLNDLYINFNNVTILIDNINDSFIEIKNGKVIIFENGYFKSNAVDDIYSAVSLFHIYNIDKFIINNINAINVNSVLKTDYIEDGEQPLVKELITNNINCLNVGLFGYFNNINKWVGDNIIIDSDNDNKKPREAFYIRSNLKNAYVKNIFIKKLKRFIFHFNRYQDDNQKYSPAIGTPGLNTENLNFENIKAIYDEASTYTSIANFNSDDNDININNIYVKDCDSLFSSVKDSKILNIKMKNFKVESSNYLSTIFDLNNNVNKIDNIELSDGVVNSVINGNSINGLVKNLIFKNVSYINTLPQTFTSPCILITKTCDNIVFDNFIFNDSKASLQTRQGIQIKDGTTNLTLKNSKFNLTSPLNRLIIILGTGSTFVTSYNNLYYGTVSVMVENNQNNSNILKFNNYKNNTLDN